MSAEFAPLLLEPAYRRVAAAIGERILSRSLREGDRLPPETELARQFAVNRSTVREALRELESRGLVRRRRGSRLMSVSRPHQQAVAAGVSQALQLQDATVHEVWEALTILEPPLAAAAARCRSPADLAALAAAVRACAAADSDTAAAVHAIVGVFGCIGRATRNRVLALAQEPLLQLLEPSLVIMIDKLPQARARIASAQRRLLEAIEARAADEAERWMARHIRDFRRGFELAGIALATPVAVRSASRPAAPTP